MTLKIDAKSGNLNHKLEAELTATWGTDGRYVDKLDLSRAEKRDKYVDRLHGLSGADRDEIRRQLADIVRKLQDRRDNGEPEADEPENIEAATYKDEEVLAELAYNCESGRLDFIVCDRQSGNVSRRDTLNTPTAEIHPPSNWQRIVTPGGHLEGNILVPTEVDPAGKNQGQLRGDVTDFINRYAELPDGLEAIAVEYILLSWVYDRFDELPYLAFRTVDVGRGKSRALETVGSLCYRPLFVGGGSSAAATLRLLDLFKGTLVADEFDGAHNTELGADLNRILNQGFQSRRPLVKCDGENNAPRPFACFGPKLFALRQRLGDDATESRTISVRMRQRTRDLPLNLPRVVFDAEALALRNRLLASRFALYDHTQINPLLRDPSLEDRTNQIGLPLLAVARTPEAQERIVRALREQQAGIAEDRADTLAGETLRAILAVAKPGDVVRPGDLAAEINRSRAEADGVDVDKLGKRLVDSRKVGWVLKGDLDLPRDEQKRDKSGARYRVDVGRWAQLCQRFGITPQETSPTSQRQRQLATSPENGLFDSARGDNDVGDIGDVFLGTGAEGDGHASPKVPDGWSREGWIRRLRQRAEACADDHPDLAAQLQREADALEKKA